MSKMIPLTAPNALKSLLSPIRLGVGAEGVGSILASDRMAAIAHLDDLWLASYDLLERAHFELRNMAMVKLK